MNRISTLIITSCLIGLLATSTYLKKIQGMRNDIVLMSEKVPVLTVTRDIKAGELLMSVDLEVKSLLKNQLSRRTIPTQDIELIAGRRVIHPIPKGEPVLWTDFPEGPRVQFPSEMIPAGQRVLALPADEIHTLVHFISPGDSIDIISSTFDNSGSRLESRVIAEDIIVLGVGRQLARQSNKTIIEDLPLSVTLLVTPEKALEILRASQVGEIHFLARRSDPFSRLSIRNSHTTILENQTGVKS
jgi:Flp pilus assembly protein CpaB